MADRLDVDDPFFGFMVRTNKVPNDFPVDQMDYFHKGMLQGFITVTTYTNWQKSFRWDSTHNSAFAYDEPDLGAKMDSNEVKWDRDGSIAAAMQNTVRCGDPWNEGIVWPKIAEISLLGALGCGKALLSLVIERLESMQATEKYNYDFVCLQATDNSKRFYESMGFVRVGCITEQRLKASASGDKVLGDDEEEEEEKAEIVSSPVLKITMKKHGETAADYAKKFGVNVWDIIFLSHYMYPGMTPNAPLWKGTILYIPDISKLDGCTAATNGESSVGGATHWYSCEDNESPKEIAKKFNVACKDLLAANRVRIADLKAHSKLIEGTRLQVSNLHQTMDEAVPYIHWTFPDSKFEDNPDPSYMMARRLNRKNRFQSKIKPVESSFAIQVQSEYDSSAVPTSVVQAPKDAMPTTTTKTTKKTKKRKRHPEQPLIPKRPKTAFFVFLSGERERLKAKNMKISMIELTKVASQHWKVLPDETRAPFLKEAEKLRCEYDEKMKKYQNEIANFRSKYPDWDNEDDHDEGPSKKGKTSGHLFNKVVKLTKEGQRQAGEEFQYYYVLTYIPDLFWCHLAPLRNVGVFGSNRKKSEGRTKWMLVHEGEGKEMDITGAVCQAVKSRSTGGSRCTDADKEEWDIIDTEADAATSRPSQYLQNNEDISDKQTSLKSNVSREIATTNNENPQSDTSTASTRTVDANLHHALPTNDTVVCSSGSDAANRHERTTMDMDTSKGQLLDGNSDHIPESDTNSEGDSDELSNENLSSKAESKPLYEALMEKVITPIIQRNRDTSTFRTSSVQTSLKSFFNL